jgi:predicted methyltransferase MtxX (methanogen marker protein 4)
VAAEFLRKTHREAYVLAGGVSRSSQLGREHVVQRPGLP